MEHEETKNVVAITQENRTSMIRNLIVISYCLLDLVNQSFVCQDIKTLALMLCIFSPGFTFVSRLIICSQETKFFWCILVLRNLNMVGVEESKFRSLI